MSFAARFAHGAESQRGHLTFERRVRAQEAIELAEKTAGRTRYSCGMADAPSHATMPSKSGWSIRTRLVAGLGVVLVLVLGMAAITYGRIAEVRRPVVAIETDSIAGLITP